jgi:hypothetical protein
MKKHLFLGSLTAALALFAACDGGGDDLVGSTVTPPPGKYNIDINVTDVPGLEGLGTAKTSIENGGARFDVTTADRGQVVILTVNPPVGGGGGEENDEPIYYFLSPITATVDKNGQTSEFYSFTRSDAASNEYTFAMPDGNLTIEISFTDKADPTNAYLRRFGTSGGELIEGGPSDDYAYMVILPHDFVTETPAASTLLLEQMGGQEEESNEDVVDNGFYIYAQAENQAAVITLQKGKPGATTEENLFNTALDIEEGLNPYTITVTPEETESQKKYYIKVIKLPDLSLSEFKVTHSTDFSLDLDTANKTQDVYVPYTSGVKIVATPKTESGATVTILPSDTVSPNSVQTPVTVTVKVWKPELVDLEDEYRQSIYTLNLYYGEGLPSPLAMGGIVSFTPVSKGGSYDEVHIFRESGTLAFLNAPTAENSINAWVLVVGGGGGGGIAHAAGNSGGAGGVAEHEAYPLTAGSFTVIVGAGGAGGKVVNSNNYPEDGSNGGDSSFGTESALFTAYGGGGGGGNYKGHNPGHSGGSSGGGGNGDVATATKGIAPYGGQTYGNAGAATDRSPGYTGNTMGGGGAGGTGQGNNGGHGITRSITGADVIYAAGGGLNSPVSDAASGSGNGGRFGQGATPGMRAYNGGSGIVIVRFQHPGNTASE